MNETTGWRLDPAVTAEIIRTSHAAELAVSPELTVIACNEAYSRLHGVSADTLVGRPVQQIFRKGAALELLIASLESVLHLRRPHRTTGPAPILTHGKPATDRTAPALSIINIPVLGTDGEVKWILHGLDTAPDGSGSLGVAMALEAAEARLRSVLQTVPDAMIIIDDRGRIESLSITAEQLFGYAMDEIAGYNVSRLMPSPDREQHASYLKRYLATGERRIIGIGRIVVGQRKDGTTFPMHLTVGELRSAEQHYFTGFIRDLTTQQITEAPEIADHLFQPFVTTKRKGMGLGLSISRTIVEAHGGKIWVEGRPGGGTIFHFTLRNADIEEANNAG
jgi:two-component system sensor kinase FixL